MSPKVCSDCVFDPVVCGDTLPQFETEDMEVNQIKSNGVAWEAAVLKYRPGPAPRGWFALTSISLGRDHEVGIVEPLKPGDGLVPTPSGTQADTPEQCERLNLTAA